MENLKTKEGREKAIRQIEEEFLTVLRKNNVELSEEVVCSIYQDRIELGIIDKYSEIDHRITFESIIELYPKSFKRENEINYSSSGSFNPSNRASYWKTIHAASILKNWDIVSEMVNKYVRMYNDLINKIFDV
jgi:hypothetical protein